MQTPPNPADQSGDDAWKNGYPLEVGVRPHALNGEE